MAARRRSFTSPSRSIFIASFLALSWACPSPAQGMHGGHGSSMHGGPAVMGYVGHHQSGGIIYNPAIYYGYGVGGAYVYSPPLVVFTPGFTPFLAPAFPQGLAMGGMGGGLNLPAPPPGLVDLAPVPRPRPTNPAKAKELTEIGDRSFRAHNIKRAEDKYKLALKADPTSPTPHVHLAQVSIARGNYAAAADHLRDAVTVAGDGTWLVNFADIQAIFGEPADFARQVGRLETHLQANPNDREAWFVLGAETYLSGRSRQAFDIFQRLTDRRADEALTAFMDASRPRPAAAN